MVARLKAEEELDKEKKKSEEPRKPTKRQKKGWITRVDSDSCPWQRALTVDPGCSGRPKSPPKAAAPAKSSSRSSISSRGGGAEIMMAGCLVHQNPDQNYDEL